MQACPDCATCLKFFKQDGSYDVICSGSLPGIQYEEVTSVSTGYKEDYEMHSLDFEEFLWAKGYAEEQTDGILDHMLSLTPFSELEYSIWMENFREYMTLGGMPKVVDMFVSQKNYSGTLNEQVQILRAYEEDIVKYASGLDKAKIKNIYTHIPVFLAKENKRYQITKVAPGARNREYAGTVDWLSDAGIVNVCYCLGAPELPLKGNYNPKEYKIYFRDTGLLVASLDEEAQADLRQNRNVGFNGSFYTFPYFCAFMLRRYLSARAG